MRILISPDKCSRCGRALTFDLLAGGGWRCSEHGAVFRAAGETP